MISTLVPASSTRFSVNRATGRATLQGAHAACRTTPFLEKSCRPTPLSIPGSRRSRQCYFRLHCMKGNAGAQINSDDVPEGTASDSSNDSADTPSSDSEGSAAKIDLHAGTKRTMLVQFTCDRCETRSERLVNPEAYARGTVFVQCQGCEVWHQLVDHMGLIQEYDLRAEAGSNAGEQHK